MSTRSGKRIHDENDKHIKDLKNGRKTRSRKPKENTENVDVPSNKKHYVKYPSEEDADVERTIAESIQKPRKSQRTTLKELNSIDEVNDPFPIRHTRRTKRLNDDEIQVEMQVQGNDKANKNSKKNKKSKSNKESMLVKECIAEQKKGIRKKKKKKSSLLNVERIGNGEANNRSNISLDSFHSAAGSNDESSVVDNVDINVSNRMRKSINISSDSQVLTSIDPDFLSTNSKGQLNFEDQIQIDKKIKKKIISPSTSNACLDHNSLLNPKLNNSCGKQREKKNRFSMNLNKCNNDKAVDNNPKLNQDDESDHKSDSKNCTYDKIDLEIISNVSCDNIDKLVIASEKQILLPNIGSSRNNSFESKYINESNGSIHNNSVKTLNNTFDKTPTEKAFVSKDRTPKTDTTFEMPKTILNSTFDKPQTDSSKSSLLTSDASNATYNKSNDSRISITSDNSQSDNIVNTTPVMIESSMDETHVCSIKITPEEKKAFQTPLKREGTFTKETSPTANVNKTPRRMSIAGQSPGRTPFPASKSSSKEKSKMNVTRSIEKSRRSLVEVTETMPKITRVMFCSPMNTPIITNHIKGKVIKSNLKGSSKSFVFDDSATSVVSPFARKRSYTQSEVDRVHAKRKRLTEEQQHSIDRLSRPRTTSASAKLEDSKKTTPSKPKDKLRRKLPNFAVLHQKEFDKMESLDECQERKAKRARQMLTPSGSVGVIETTSLNETEQPKTNDTKKTVTASSSRITVPTLESINPGYTRFGFKMNSEINPFNNTKPEVKKANGTSRHTVGPSLAGAAGRVVPSLAGAAGRRETAKHTVMREKPFSDKRNVTRNENRTIIKGVRTNRRFELQMKLRNIN